MRSVIFFALLALAHAGTYPDTGDYPSKYSVSEEVYEQYDNVEMPTNMPDFTYADDDAGNYIGLVYRANTWYGDAELGFHKDNWHWINTRTMSYFTMGVLKRASPATPMIVFNCSAKPKFVSADVPTTWNGKKLCDKECCSSFDNTWAFTADWLEYQTSMETLLNGGACSDVTEEFVCQLTYGKVLRNCLEQYVTESERAAMQPCHDNLMASFLSCKLYLQTGVETQITTFEPKNYRSSLTPAQTILAYTVAESPDRVCHPYTYYYPEGLGEVGSAAGFAPVLATAMAAFAMLA